MSAVRGIAFGVCIVALTFGCRRESAEADLPVIVVSVPPQADIVERLAGEFVDVVVMVPPGANPTTYEPTMSQMRAMTDMRLYVKVGHPHFPFEETWFDRILDQAGGSPSVDCASDLPLREDDPHIWLAPSCMRIMAGKVAANLVLLFPGHEKAVRANLERLMTEIDELDEDVRGRLDKHRGEKFLVFHPAWGYFAQDYGLVQIAIEHGHKEPSPARLAYVIEQARHDGVKVIFVQPQFSEESADLVAEAIGAEIVILDPLARDWFANMRAVAAALDDGLSQ